MPPAATHPRPARARAAAGIALAIGGLALAAGGEAPVRTSAQPAAGPVVWIEGEAATRTTFNRHGWYCCDGVRRDLLSPGEPGARDGDWLVHYANDGREAEAEYHVDAPVAGSYTLWLRASSFTVRMWHRLDGGPRIDVDTESDRREHLNLLTAGRIDIRFLAWYRTATLDLTAGRHTLTIGLTGHPARQDGREVHGGIDVVAVADGDWNPSGTLRPGDLPVSPGPADWFPLIPADDPFDPRSVTAVGDLVPRPAGRRGPVARDGASLRFADGTPAVFWGVNAAIGGSQAVMERQAAWYARQGINLVRLHPVQALLGVLARDPATGARSLDPERLDRLDRWFAALKANGIYMQWSPFYPHVLTEDDGYPPDLYAELPDATAWNLPAGMRGKHTAGFVNVMPDLQAAEWAWLSTLLTHRNPYTGLRYVDDPALAIVEVHNEDSIFWHYPLNPLAGGRDGDRSLDRHQAALQGMWADWLRERYGDDGALLRAWGPPGQGSRPGDELGNRRMPIYGAWEMQADGPSQNKAERQRMGDFIAFLAARQRAYFAGRVAQLRDLGFQGVTVTTAWQAGGPAANLANVYTDTAADMIDRHRYFGGHAEASLSPHRVAAGAVRAASHLATPGGGILGASMEQVEDRPFMLSEWTQSPPNEWKAEIAPLVAFYGMGLQGWDASNHFSASQPRMGGGWPNDMDAYVTETPHFIGQFPALARSVLRRDIATGAAAAAMRFAPSHIFGGVDAASQPVGLGWRDDPAADRLATPLEALAIGRVSVRIQPDPGLSERVDWGAFRDGATGRIRSTTGELAWDPGRRVVTVAAARTQAVIGFAGGRAFDLPAAVVDVRTAFVSLILTALDAEPLERSRHILVTALARDRQAGARYSADGAHLEAVGGPPLLLEPVEAVIALKGPPVTSARPLDIHGIPRAVEVERDGNRIVIDGRYTTYLYAVRRDAPAGPTAEATPTTAPPGAATPTAGATAARTPAATTAAPPPTTRSWVILPWVAVEHADVVRGSGAWRGAVGIPPMHPLPPRLTAHTRPSP